MRVITGDEFGIIKECILPTRNYAVVDNLKHKKKKDSDTADEKKLPQKKITILNKSCSSRSQGVVSLSQLSSFHNDNNSYSFAALMLDGSLHSYHVDLKQQNSTTSTTVSKLDNIFELKAPSSISADAALPIAMGSITTSSKDEQHLIACNSHGHLSVLKWSQQEHQYNVVSQYQDIDASTTGSNKITAFATSNTSNTCAMGGRNQQINVICLETGKSIWKSKNVKPSLKTLLDEPVWTTALQYYDSSNSTDNNLLVAGTAYKQVQLYDIRTQLQRRPIMFTPKSLLNYRLTSLLTKETSKANTVIVGDAAGGIHSFDIRKMDKILHRYVGPVGSVRSISSSISSKSIYFSCVGLDRYLRIFDITKPRKALDNIYLKQRLNCCITYDDIHNDDEDFFNFVDRKEQDYATASNEEVDEEDRVDDYNYNKKRSSHSANAADHDKDEEKDTIDSSSTSSDESLNSNDELDDDDDDLEEDSGSSGDILDDDDDSSSSNDSVDDDDREDYKDPFTAVQEKSSSPALNYASMKKRKKS